MVCMLQNIKMNLVSCLVLLLIAAAHAQDVENPDEELEQIPYTGPTPEVILDVDEALVLPGANVTFVCRIKNMPEGQSRFWSKAVPLPDGNRKTEALSGQINGFLPPYNQLSRYRMSFKEEGLFEYHYLYINRVTIEDAGNIKCGLLQDSKYEISQEVYFSVYRQIDSVSFFNHSNGDTLVIQENQPVPLECTVTGGAPQPHASVYIEGTTYTDRFQRTVTPRVYCDEAQFDKTPPYCPVNHDYVITFNTSSFMPSYKDDGKQLICGADVTGSGLDVVTSYVNLEMHYTPKIECDASQVAVLHEAGKIECIIQARPEVLSAQYRFVMGEDETILKPGDEPVDGIVVTREQVPDNSLRYKLVLTIEKTFKRHFIQYTLEASNQRGSDAKQITLSESYVPASKGSNTVGTTLALAVTIVMAYVLH